MRTLRFSIAVLTLGLLSPAGTTAAPPDYQKATGEWCDNCREAAHFPAPRA